MPSWSVLTSNWGKRPERESKGSKAESGVSDWTAGKKVEAKKRDHWIGGVFGSSHQGKAKREGQEYEIAERQSQERERRVENNAIRI